MDKKAVLVTTKFRGVFFGYIKDDSKLPEEITLTDVRNCRYWSADIKGFLGLASLGPSSDCKIGKKVSQVTLWKITSVSHVEKEAIKKWEVYD